MQVDFYQLTRDPAEKLVPVLAQKVVDAGKRLLIVSDSESHRAAISAELWTARPDSFLAHAEAGEGTDEQQPILLSALAVPANGATYMLFADGKWHSPAADTERVFYLFPPEQTDDARKAWKELGDAEGVERHYWRQDGGKWIEGP